MQIIFHTQHEYDQYAEREHDSRHYYVKGKGVRRELAKLRFVCKVFCRSASIWLFRHIDARPNASNTIPSLERLERISKSPYAVHVRVIDFGFYTTLPRDITAYVEDLKSLLPPCLIRFPNLKALNFGEAPGYLTRLEKGLYYDALVSILQYIPLPNLTELEVKSGITQDFARFFPTQPDPLRISMGKVMERLRHLGIFTLSYPDVRDPRVTLGLSGPERATLPDSTHTFHLFRMVELAPNLESLAIRCIEILNLDRVAFSHSLRLRSLYLGRVLVSSTTLLSLFSQSASKMRYISFWYVKLNSGTWREVLSQMCNLPKLLDVHIDCSGYSASGSSSHLAHTSIGSELPESIESVESSDLEALGYVQ